MSKPPLILTCLWASCFAVTSWCQEFAHRLYSTHVGRNFSIVSEVSQPGPYVGQQFSVVYSLRAPISPRAVDVEPQEYAGFWTETIPLPEETHYFTRIVNGKPAYEFMLRQVVAYPLAEGDLLFPPVGVKIKIGGDLTAGKPNWDIVAQSDPVPIRVRPIPSSPWAGKGSPFVGSIHGRFSETDTTDGHEILLEVQGTANLAFFNPQEWFRQTGGRHLPPRLVSAENDVQIRDIGGKRVLTLAQRQRWSIRLFPEGEKPLRIEDMVLPVFQAADGAWRMVRIAGPSLKSSAFDSFTQGLVSSSSDVSSQRSATPWLRSIWHILALVLLGASSLGLARLWWVRRKGAYSGAWVHSSLAILEKQHRAAPRSFLETAHRILERYAAERRLTPMVGNQDTAFDRCWTQIEKTRFTSSEISSKERTRILHSIRLILQGAGDPGQPKAD